MDLSTIGKLVGVLAAGVVLEVIAELLLAPLLKRVARIWWIEALGRVPAFWVLLPAWLLAFAAIWWAVQVRFASVTSAVLFVVFPAAAAALTIFRLRHPPHERAV
jgi:hypothetical protein